MTAKPSGQARTVGGLLGQILSMRIERFPGVGLGEELRLRDNETVGAALVADGILAHLMAFPAGNS